MDVLGEVEGSFRFLAMEKRDRRKRHKKTKARNQQARALRGSVRGAEALAASRQLQVAVIVNKIAAVRYYLIATA